MLDQVAAVLSGAAHEKGLELVVGCHPDVPAVLRGDAVRFGQVITNLGSNAVKFTDARRGGRPRRALARADRRDDDGSCCGSRSSTPASASTPGARDRLFEAFTQADPSTTRRHGGTGLGLAISRQLVTRSAATSSVEQRPRRRQQLLLHRAPSGAPGARPPRRRRRRQLLLGRRVLVVDDNRTNRFMLEQQLAAWHLEPTAGRLGAAGAVALRAARRSGRPFEIALLDLVMPDVDGLELAAGSPPTPTSRGSRLLLLPPTRA